MAVILANYDIIKLYVSPKIITVIKTRRKRWTGHEFCMDDMENAVTI
jgi:hypothetical protein